MSAEAVTASADTEKHDRSSMSDQAKEIYLFQDLFSFATVLKERHEAISRRGSAMLRKIFMMFVLPKLIAHFSRRGARPRHGRTY